MDTNSDLRPPLPPDHPYPSDGYTALPFSTRRTLRSLLCRMYAATDIMELGTESRFTALVLFHRYYFAALDLMPHATASSSSGTTNIGNNKKLDEGDRRKTRQWREHLGTVAAASLFLGCKAEEEHRMIRDVINVAHMLDFAGSKSDDDDYNDEAGEIASTNGENIVIASSSGGAASAAITSDTTQSAQTSLIHIHEASEPPDLDDLYWQTKERVVATEQEVLRMICFDASVSHPHRAVLLILDALGGSIDVIAMQRLVKKSWELLNNTLFYPPALRLPLLPLACGAIWLGENMINSMDCKINGNKDENNGDDERLIMPSTWWSDLGVLEPEIKAAAVSLQEAMTALEVL